MSVFRFVNSCSLWARNRGAPSVIKEISTSRIATQHRSKSTTAAINRGLIRSGNKREGSDRFNSPRENGQRTTWFPQRRQRDADEQSRGAGRASRERFSDDRRGSLRSTTRDRFNDERRGSFRSTTRDRSSNNGRDSLSPTTRNRFSNNRRDSFSPATRDRFSADRRDSFRSTTRDQFDMDRRDSFKSMARERWSKHDTKDDSSSRSRSFARDRSPSGAATEVSGPSHVRPRSNQPGFTARSNDPATSHSNAPAVELHEELHHRGRISKSIPLAIPYSAATSEFLYGNSTVQAALRSSKRTLSSPKRKLYKLYLHPRASDSQLGTSALLRTARNCNVDIVEVDDTWLPLMDKMAQGRPHNGVILEASPVVLKAAAYLERSVAPVDVKQNSVSTFSVVIDGDDAVRSQLSYQPDGWRHPFVLLIDDVLDPGNLGAIIRSAYFLGVDALAIGRNRCAPLTNVALKASAGAAEAMPLLSVKDPRSFLSRSRESGWSVYAGVTPDGKDAPERKTTGGTNESSRSALARPGITFTPRSMASLTAPHTPLANNPCILVLGGEGKGLMRSLQAQADYFVSMKAAKRDTDIGVDSLNVSVAAAVIAADFLRYPGEGAVQASDFTQEAKGDSDGQLGF